MLEIRQSPIFERWLERLRDLRAQAVISDPLVRLANGQFGDVAPIGGGIHELRVHIGPSYRIYFQQRGQTLILLLCGGDKSSQTRDITAARRIAAEWDQSNG